MNSGVTEHTGHWAGAGDDSTDGRGLQFRILGPLEVAEGDLLVDLAGPKQRAVLAVLLLEANRVVSVDRLIDQLWRGQQSSRAAGSLQAYVSHLRRVLEPDRRGRTPGRVLVTRPPGYVLRVSASHLDAACFESLTGEGRRHLAAGRPKEARRALGDGLALWRSAVLADLADEPFAHAERTRLEELRLVALEARLEADLALGAHAAVVPELEVLVASGPLREGPRGLLMLALYRSGRQADALRVFQEARRALVDQVGLDPGPSLRRLEHDILCQSPSLEWRPPARDQAPVIEAPAPPPLPVRRQPAGLVLVGRERQLAALEAALDRASTGEGRIVLVSGESGVGKTRLVEELARRAENRGVRVAWGRCWEGHGAPPFWPWIQVARSLVAGAVPDAIRRYLGAEGEVIGQIVPEVRKLVGPPESSVSFDSEPAPFHLYDAFARFLERLAWPGPLLCLLEDLQWADVPSLELVRFLACGPPRGSLLLVGTYCQGEVRNLALERTLGALAVEPVVDTVTVPGLTADEVGRLLADSGGGLPSPALVSEIHLRTEGNPFFVQELGRLLASGGSRPDPPPSGPVPPRMRDVIRQRLARLPEATNTLLAIGAVIGRDFDFGVLERVAGLGGDRALELIEAALAAGTLVEVPDAVGRYRFSHSVVHQTLYEGLSALRRARLQARVAEVGAHAAVPGGTTAGAGRRGGAGRPLLGRPGRA